MQNLVIDAERLWGELMETAAIGGNAEGRHLPAHADRSRPAGARLVQGALRGARLHRHGRRHGRDVRAPRRASATTFRRSRWAATSTRSRPAASSTACSACSARSRRCARWCRPATRPSRRSRWSTGPTRRARASRPRWSPRACSPAPSRATGRWSREDRGGSHVRLGARCDIGYRGAEPCGEHRAFGLLRAAHRAGADPRSRGQGDRHRHRRAGHALVRGDGHRRIRAHRRDADAAAQERAARRRAARRAHQCDCRSATSRMRSARSG